MNTEYKIQNRNLKYEIRNMKNEKNKFYYFCSEIITERDFSKREEDSERKKHSESNDVKNET